MLVTYIWYCFSQSQVCDYRTQGWTHTSFSHYYPLWSTSGFLFLVSVILGSDHPKFLIPKEWMLLLDKTEVVSLHWKLRLLPGNIEILMSANQLAGKGVWILISRLEGIDPIYQGEIGLSTHNECKQNVWIERESQENVFVLPCSTIKPIETIINLIQAELQMAQGMVARFSK